jgi:hypothetical protein
MESGYSEADSFLTDFPSLTTDVLDILPDKIVIRCCICFQTIPADVSPLILQCLHTICLVCCSDRQIADVLSCPDCRLANNAFTITKNTIEIAINDSKIKLLEARIDLINYHSVALKLRVEILKSLAQPSSKFSDEFIRYTKGVLKKIEVSHNLLSDLVLAFDEHVEAALSMFNISSVSLGQLRLKFFTKYLNSLPNWVAQFDRLKFDARMLYDKFTTVREMRAGVIILSVLVPKDKLADLPPLAIHNFTIAFNFRRCTTITSKMKITDDKKSHIKKSDIKYIRGLENSYPGGFHMHCLIHTDGEYKIFLLDTIIE